MTGILAGFLTGVSVSVLVLGTVAALAVADAPAAVAVMAAFGLSGLLGALVYLRQRWRSRRRKFRLPRLAGRARTAAAMLAAAFIIAAAVTALLGLAGPTELYGAIAVLLAGWCALSAREGRTRGQRFGLPSLADWRREPSAAWEEIRRPRPRWAVRELAVFKGNAGLEQLLGTIPRARHERKFR